LPDVDIKVDGLMVASMALLGGITVLWWNRQHIAEAVEDVADKVNPASTNNIIYGAVNVIGDIGEDGTRDNDWSLGSKIYDWIHGENA